MSLTSIAPVPDDALISSVARAAEPPITPSTVVAPVPEVISRSTAPFIVLSKVTAPA